MPTTSPTGLPVTTMGDAPDLPGITLSLATSLDLVTVPLFASTSARDTAYAVRKFGLCMVGSSVEGAILYKRRSGAWYQMSDDAVRDSGWVNVTINSGFTGTSVATRRIGDIVYLRGTVKQNSGPYASGGATVGTVPAAHVPARTMRLILPGNASSTPNFCTALLASSGAFTVYGNGTAPPDTAYFDAISYSAT